MTAGRADLPGAAFPPRVGRHTLQVPGPTNVPDAVLSAIARPTIDHRGPEFGDLLEHLLPAVQRVFQTSGPVAIYPSAGTGGWEAALVNTVSPGDAVLAFDIGQFSALWYRMATDLGLKVEVVEGDWRHGAQPDQVAERLKLDGDHSIKAVLVVHNETSTGIASRIAEIRRAIDSAEHPALLLVDAISSLASIDYRHDEWGADVTVAGSQKGLMLPPGLSFNAISDKALEASTQARLPRSYWNWAPIIEANKSGVFPYTPATNLLYGLDQALGLLELEGLERVFERHHRHAEATRAAVRAWGLELVSLDQREYSDTITAVLVPEPYDADRVRATILDRFDMSLGVGLGRFQGRAFRIGHLGQLSDVALAGALSAVEMGLVLADVPISRGGAQAGLDALLATEQPAGPLAPVAS
jgi:alanine-glyoxylate transaminase/serine-glyoxylate transaminase/serine-pyruvate transaminase